MVAVSVTPTEHTSNMRLETLHKIQQEYQTKTPLIYKVRNKSSQRTSQKLQH